MFPGRYPHTLLFPLWLVPFCLWLAGCSQTPLTTKAPTAGELERLLTVPSLPENTSTAPEQLDHQLLATTLDMRHFVEVHVEEQAPPRLKLGQLLEALSDYDRGGLQHDPSTTINAGDAFARRQGNCLSLTAMVVALAREAGLRAYFNEVDLPPTVEMLNENRVAFYKHVNAAVLLGETDVEIVELTNAEYDPRRHQRRISDESALAQFYNNRAMELLAEQHYAQSFLHQRRAISLAPGESYLWSNFGAIYSRLGRYAEAEVAYRHAHHLDGDDVVALSNLARVYQATGEAEKAARFREAVSRMRSTNPFNLFIQAKDALNRDEPKLALRYIKSAIRARRDESRFHYLAALIYQRLGEMEKMRASLRRASELRASIERQKTRHIVAVR